MSTVNQEIMLMKKAIQELMEHKKTEVTIGKWRFTLADDRWLFIEYKYGRLLYDSILRADLLTGRAIRRSGYLKNQEIDLLAVEITEYATYYHKTIKESS